MKRVSKYTFRNPFELSDPAEARTQDPQIKSLLLYQLSYGVKYLKWDAKVMLFALFPNVLFIFFVPVFFQLLDISLKLLNRNGILYTEISYLRTTQFA